MESGSERTRGTRNCQADIIEEVALERDLKGA